MTQEQEDRVRQRAYEIWECEGCPDDQDLGDPQDPELAERLALWWFRPALAQVSVSQRLELASSRTRPAASGKPWTSAK